MEFAHDVGRRARLPEHAIVGPNLVGSDEAVLRAERGRSLDHFGVPAREKDEVLSAFGAHKGEVTEGSMASA